MTNAVKLGKKKRFYRKRFKRMKYIRQLGIILLVSFLGELLHYLLPLPVPASIYGIVLLFAALETRLLKADAIRETSAFRWKSCRCCSFLRAWVFWKSGTCCVRVAAVCRDRRCIDVHGVRRRRVHHAARDASAPETGG